MKLPVVSRSLPKALSLQQNNVVRTITTTAEGVDDVIPPPNRMTVVYQKMKETCPDKIRAYAACVAKTQRGNGELVQGSCQEEFQHVQECFKTVRRSLKS
jgi:hypothetical protein